MLIKQQSASQTFGRPSEGKGRSPSMGGSYLEGPLKKAERKQRDPFKGAGGSGLFVIMP